MTSLGFGTVHLPVHESIDEILESDDGNNSFTSDQFPVHGTPLNVNVDYVVAQVHDSVAIPMDLTNEDCLGFGVDEIPIASTTDIPLTVHGDPRSIPGCVLLNNVGALLRRKQQIERH
jgi:hypothetical protein